MSIFTSMHKYISSCRDRMNINYHTILNINVNVNVNVHVHAHVHVNCFLLSHFYLYCFSLSIFSSLCFLIFYSACCFFHSSFYSNYGFDVHYCIFRGILRCLRSCCESLGSFFCPSRSKKMRIFRIIVFCVVGFTLRRSDNFFYFSFYRKALFHLIRSPIDP